MSQLKKFFLHNAAAILSFALFAPANAAILAASDDQYVVVIGNLVAGDTYLVTATGESNTLAGFNGGLGLTFTANGIPTYTFPSPYTGFNPNGANNDVSGTSGFNGTPFGQGGVGNLIGALLGTFSVTGTAPTLTGIPGSFFTLGTSDTITPTVNETLYAVVNDSYYADNPSTGFSVTLQDETVTSAVPELSSWAMMVLGFAGLGFMSYRSRSTHPA